MGFPGSVLIAQQSPVNVQIGRKSRALQRLPLGSSQRTIMRAFWCAEFLKKRPESKSQVFKRAFKCFRTVKFGYPFFALSKTSDWFNRFLNGPGGKPCWCLFCTKPPVSHVRRCWLLLHSATTGNGMLSGYAAMMFVATGRFQYIMAYQCTVLPMHIPKLPVPQFGRSKDKWTGW